MILLVLRHHLKGGRDFLTATSKFSILARLALCTGMIFYLYCRAVVAYKTAIDT